MSFNNPQTEHRPKVSALQIRDLSVQVHLGCTAEERSLKQEVRLSIEFRFSEPPVGALTDSLQDTICYAEASKLLRQHCEQGEFQLIERIGAECYSLLKEFTGGKNAEIALHVHKVKPPVENLLQGTHFRCGDFFL